MTMLAEALRRRAYSVARVRELARRRLPGPVFDFTDGAAEDERTLRRSEEAYREIELLPHPLSGAAERDLSVTLLVPTGLRTDCQRGTGRFVSVHSAIRTCRCGSEWLGAPSDRWISSP
jgi:hypothetical protein